MAADRLGRGAVDQDIADPAVRRGFGSVKVIVRVGGSEWRTSVFPQKSGGWFLPVKKAIQRAEGLMEGEPVEAELELR